MQHPYPTEDEKKQIAAQTNLTLIQVNNWSVCVVMCDSIARTSYCNSVCPSWYHVLVPNQAQVR